jgi:phytoene desaturase
MAELAFQLAPGNAPRAAIIASGFGGLAAAIRLPAAGLQTMLFEARDLPGGRAYALVLEDLGARAVHPSAASERARGAGAPG